MPARLRPPSEAEACAVLDPVLAHAELNVHGRNRGALRLYVSVGMRPTWEAERWEKALGA